jgi:DNA-binding LytR/AlgR family response regulator
MKILKCMVVDDEPLAVSLLETFIKRTPGLILLESFTDSVLALSRIKEEKPDLVFMDIQMPDLNGIELSKMLPPEISVIITTAFREYALEGYSVSALDYLTKPISYQKFLEAVLPKGSFMRVHRSYIVALDKIDSVLPGMNIMIGRTLIYVSKVYESPLLRYLKGRSL